jgi:pyruvate carboxylase subunit B
VYNVVGGERYVTVTQELKDYLQGLYGRPPAAVDPELRRLVIGREEPITIRPADLLEPQVDAARQHVRRLGHEATDDVVLIQLMFPSLAADYMRGPQPAQQDGHLPEAPPPPVEEETQTAEALPAAADPSPPQSAAEFDVEVEGEVFKVRVMGAGVMVAAGPPAPSANAAPAPTKVGEGTVISPMQGLIVKVPVNTGDTVRLGDVVAVLEAMKMQNDIVTTIAGTVQAVYVKEGEVVSPNQALLAIA